MKAPDSFKEHIKGIPFDVTPEHDEYEYVQVFVKSIEELIEFAAVALKEKVPVLIEYRTAWMGHDGRVNFREDIYGHDKTQLRPLEKAISEVQ